jgi:uncharacterized membrane protein YtjA (UPF0391 family)
MTAKPRSAGKWVRVPLYFSSSETFGGAPGCRADKRTESMLKGALIFLVVALVAGSLGLTGLAGIPIAIAKTLFFISLLIFVVLLVDGLGRKFSG